MKIILLTSVLSLSLFIGNAQIKMLDSLEHELTISRPDTNRVLELQDVHLAQVLNYLKAYKLEIFLLINFGSKSLTFKRLIL